MFLLTVLRQWFCLVWLMFGLVVTDRITFVVSYGWMAVFFLPVLVCLVLWSPYERKRYMWLDPVLAVELCVSVVWFRILSRLMTKLTKWHGRPAKTQISLGIRPVWSESSLSAWRKLGSLAIHWAQNEDSGQTGRMPKLIWVFDGCTIILLALSWGGSFIFLLLRARKGLRSWIVALPLGPFHRFIRTFYSFIKKEQRW